MGKNSSHYLYNPGIPLRVVSKMDTVHVSLKKTRVELRSTCRSKIRKHVGHGTETMGGVG